MQDLKNKDKQLLVAPAACHTSQLSLASGFDLLNLPPDSEDKSVLVLLHIRTFDCHLHGSTAVLAMSISADC